MSEVVDVLLDACPSFAATWDADENGLDRRPGRGGLPAVFGATETLLVEGNEEVQTLAVVRLLEGLQTSGTPPVRVRRLAVAV